jgi:hypothetical protein
MYIVCKNIKNFCIPSKQTAIAHHRLALPPDSKACTKFAYISQHGNNLNIYMSILDLFCRRCKYGFKWKKYQIYNERVSE